MMQTQPAFVSRHIMLVDRSISYLYILCTMSIYCKYFPPRYISEMYIYIYIVIWYCRLNSLPHLSAMIIIIIIIITIIIDWRKQSWKASSFIHLQPQFLQNSLHIPSQINPSKRVDSIITSVWGVGNSTRGGITLEVPELVSHQRATPNQAGRRNRCPPNRTCPKKIHPDFPSKLHGGAEVFFGWWSPGRFVEK